MLVIKNELRCLSCICAGCPIEYSCKEKPCTDTTNPFECINVSFQCDTYENLQNNEIGGDNKC